MRSLNQPPMRKGSADDFQTPTIALQPLIPFLNKNWTIWECSCGKGNLLTEFFNKGFNVLGTDLINGEEFDFLRYSPENFDCIVTNPPYSLKEKFIERCYQIGKPFALLMPLTALESERRQKLYRENGIQLIIPNRRINFETPSGKGGGAWFATAWFCWKLNLPKDLMFIEMNR